MRILFWNQLFLPSIGGVEIMTSRLAAALIARGHEVAVVATRQPKSLAAHDVINGVAVHRFPFSDALSQSHPRASIDVLADIVAKVSSLKRQFRPDVVHTNLSDASPYFHLRSRNAHRCPSILMFHAALRGRFIGDGVLSALIRDATLLVAPCRAGAVNVAETTGIPVEAIRVVTPGIPTADYVPRPTAEDGAIPSFVFLGRLVDYKGADVAIEAIARLGGAACLRVIGDGPDRAKLERLVLRHGLTQLVKFDGPIMDQQKKDQALAAALAMVVPSYKELFGTVAAEAALAGLPVIASRVGGLPETVVHGQTGLLVPPGDIGATANAMMRLVNEPALALQMGLAGRQHALENYTLERTAAAFEQIYAECARC